MSCDKNFKINNFQLLIMEAHKKDIDGIIIKYSYHVVSQSFKLHYITNKKIATHINTCVKNKYSLDFNICDINVYQRLIIIRIQKF